jgi:HAD hydrolase, family IA, variant 1
MDKLLSLIIPVYGTEKYLPRCIDSVLGQVYKNIEVIVVNDCSPGNVTELVEDYMSKDARIKYVSHDVNKGLFKARLTGSDLATGDYIAFLDSDDYVTKDYYYALMKKAEEKQTDIVVSNTVLEDAYGKKTISHFHAISLDVDYISGEDVRNKFYKVQGRCYAWHTIWNKIYKKSLWDKARPYYSNIKEHVIMLEDVAFSSVLFYFAQSLTKTDYGAIFYCENENASTNTKNIAMSRYEKSMKDIINVFTFIGDFLKLQNASEDIMAKYKSFKKFYAGLWMGLAYTEFVGKYQKKAYNLIHELEPGIEAPNLPEEYFFDSVRTDWNSEFNVIVEYILAENTEYVSFDIFDTLITRPVYKPEQVFDLLDTDFKKLTNTNLSFSKVRTDSEKIARTRAYKVNPEYQDITLSDIYVEMQDVFGLEKDVAEKLKNREIELELELLVTRNSAKYLYDLAKSSGKKVIIVSDMYLEKDIIEEILKKHSYTGYEKLFLSSDIRLTKYSIDLFKYVLNYLSIQAGKVLHIGDTWINDYVNPRSIGMNSLFFPKAAESFENIIQTEKTNLCATKGDTIAGAWIKRTPYKRSLKQGMLISMIANKYFDNPFRSFNSMSDFNADPYFIGYYPVGMHMLGFVQWLLKEAKLRQYKKLCFMSRDGYLPMKAYEMYSKSDPEAPKFEYIYTSRKSLMPYIVQHKEDLYQYPTVVTNQTPISMKGLLYFCTAETEEKEYRKIMKENGIDIEKRFEDEKEYYNFVNVYLKYFYSQETHENSKRECSKYFECIDESTATVDMGYSGRIQGALSEAVGRGVDVFFVHADDNRHEIEMRQHDYKIISFYDFTPYMSGVIREHILSSTEPSCIGYTKTGEPILEFEEKCVADNWVIETIQKGAIDFINDSLGKIKLFEGNNFGKSIELSLPFEGFARNAKEMDLQIFRSSFFEDEVWGGSRKINIADFIRNQHAEYNTELYYPDINKADCIQNVGQAPRFVKLKSRLEKFPFLLKVAQKVYRKIK